MPTMLPPSVASIIGHVASYISGFSPAMLCQLFYSLTAAAVLTIAALPESTRRSLVQYGARSVETPPLTSNATSSPIPQSKGKCCRGSEENGNNSTEPDPNTGSTITLMTRITSLGKVPHAWFIHFYVTSVSCSLFWAIQFAYHGGVLDFIAQRQAQFGTVPMTLIQVIAAWSCMAVQGVRRLYEHFAVMKASSSQMWLPHWLMGITFYACTSVSIWVEGSESLVRSSHTLRSITTPSLKLILGAFLFLASSLVQYRCHKYLSELKKYSLPEDGLFRYLVCPHYTCECVLYLSLAILAAPAGRPCNQTMLYAVIFVSVNLGVTAIGTRKWYSEKFGRRSVEKKWTMIPLVF
ncbi:hypothetical protein F5Y15DRAFT_245236 [Xylariaceae sp. FL0016]|nr:hypothetical protein F5Y15DRAFT_245236 [Xylariaceae sp. FL0016]